MLNVVLIPAVCIQIKMAVGRGFASCLDLWEAAPTI
jgi:hypothetical protein